MIVIINDSNNNNETNNSNNNNDNVYFNSLYDHGKIIMKLTIVIMILITLYDII